MQDPACSPATCRTPRSGPLRSAPGATPPPPASLTRGPGRAAGVPEEPQPPAAPAGLGPDESQTGLGWAWGRRRSSGAVRSLRGDGNRGREEGQELARGRRRCLERPSGAGLRALSGRGETQCAGVPLLSGSLGNFRLSNSPHLWLYSLDPDQRAWVPAAVFFSCFLTDSRTGDFQNLRVGFQNSCCPHQPRPALMASQRGWPARNSGYSVPCNTRCSLHTSCL